MSEGTLTAEELAQAYETDPDRARREFDGEEIDVRGRIRRIDNVISAVVPRLQGTGEKFNGTHIEVKLRRRSDAKSLSTGDEVHLRGRCEGLKTGSSPSGEDIAWVVVNRAEVID